MITDENINEIRRIISPGDDAAIISACDYITDHLTNKLDKHKKGDRVSSEFMIHKFINHLLSNGRYEMAAKILWGPELFTADPASVKMIWEEVPRSCEVAIMGAGSMGKSYSVAVWLLLDWLRDPEKTCIKVLSVTEEHAKRNVFAHIKNLHASAIIPLPGIVQERSIQVGDDDKQGIHLVRIPAGDNGKGRLRGFHPVPRGTNHPQFGTLTRIRVILDEAEEIPQGVWEDVGNILGNKDGVEIIKVIAASNPKDINSKFGQICEPANGWETESIDFSERWISRLGWRVLRIDGAKCENVTQGKIVYPGLLTLEGYQNYLRLPSGAPEYFTMGRGWFPTSGITASAFPMDLVPKVKGTFIFSGKTTFCAAADLAFEGDDKVSFAVGRVGMASGWTPLNKPSILFTQPKFVLQIEQIISLPKKRTLELSKDIRLNCHMLNISSKWLVVDRTGNGTGTHDALSSDDKEYGMGSEVMGLHYGEAATETKILDDEKEKACDNYDGVITELFLAFRKWAEFDHVKIYPHILTPEIVHQLTDRRYKQGKLKKMRLESKRDYKDRNGNRSPDEIDSVTMLLHLVRIRGEFGARMLDDETNARTPEDQTGIVDKLEFISFDD